MRAFLSDYIYSLIFLSTLSVVVFLIGHIFYVLFSNTKRTTFQSFYIKIATGLIAIVVFYAVFRTVFLTMYTGVLLAFIYNLINKREQFAIDFWRRIKLLELGPFAYYIVSLLFVCLGVVFLYHFDNRLFVHSDLAFFASLGSSLHEFGVEFLNTDPVMVGEANASIYHYFNEWFIAMLMTFTHFTSLKVFLILVIPFMAAVISAGALSLTNDFIPKASFVKKVFFSWTFLIIPGILSFSLYFITNLSFHAPYSILQSGIVMVKVKIVVILLLLFFVDFKNNTKRDDFFFLSLIPLFWNTLIPAFLGAYLMYVVYKYIKKSALSPSLIVQLFLPLVFLPVYIRVFNSINCSNLTNIVDVNRFELKDYLLVTYSDVDYVLKTSVFYIFPVTIIYFLIVGKYRKLIDICRSRFKSFRYEYQNTGLLFLFIGLAAVLSYGLLRSLFDARQIVMNLFYPIINIIVFLFIMSVLRNTHKYTVSVLTILYSLILFHALYYRSGTFKSLSEFTRYGIFKEPETVLISTDTATTFTPMSLYKKPYLQLLMLNENFKPIRLDVFFSTSNMSPKEKMEYYLNVRNQAFYRYIIMNNLPPDSASSKIKFLTTYKIKYLLTDTIRFSNTYLNKVILEKVEFFDKGVYLLEINYK